MPTFIEESFVDQIIIEPKFGAVLWRKVNVVKRDGVEISRTYERSSVQLDETNPHMPPEVAPFRALADTPQARKNKRDRDADNERGPRPKA